MFNMIANQIIHECSRIETQISDISGQMLELEQTIRELCGISGMEEVLTRLEDLYSEMDCERFALKQMTFGLNKSVLSYLSCENRICDNSEQNVLYYARREIGTYKFP